MQKNAKNPNPSGAGLLVIHFMSNFSSLMHHPYSHGWFNTIKLSKCFFQKNVRRLLKWCFALKFFIPYDFSLWIRNKEECHPNVKSTTTTGIDVIWCKCQLECCVDVNTVWNLTDIDLLLPKTVLYLREASYVKNKRHKYQNNQSKWGAYNMFKLIPAKWAGSVSRDLNSVKKT